jgi:Xaa-Pro aminopeptidase
MEIDWHAERANRPDRPRIDLAPTMGGNIDLPRVRRYRLDRLRTEMRARDIAACFLFDPVNVRYATGARNMQVFHLRNPSRYLFLPTEGPVILFEFTGCMHLARDLDTIDEVRPAITASFVAAGERIVEVERQWARACADLVREICGAGVRVGLERVNAGAARAFADQGFGIVDAQAPVERARAIKSSDELACIRASIRATERAVEHLRGALRPGITENELWSILHQGVIAQGGDYVETRLLSSGPRTNPWFQESADRVIEQNELVALDTDVVGCHGYYCDFSRTFHAGPGKPTGRQRELYRIAHQQVHHNMDLLGPGLTFRDYSERAWPIPEDYVANRYYLSGHGVGMTGEYPYLYHRMDFEEAGYDGVVEPGMTLCVESYIGERNGVEGVKLEQQVVITDTGYEVLTDFPFEQSLLS